MHITILFGILSNISTSQFKDLLSNFIILKYSKLVQLRKKQAISVTCEKSKFDIFNELKEEYYSNICSILFTFEVSKLDKSNEVNDDQFLNISNINLTLSVLNPEKFIDVNDIQSVNIYCASLMLELSKLDKSISVISEHL